MVLNRLVRSAISSLAFVLCLGAASWAQAGFMPDFTGYTQIGGGTDKGIVDFAVWHNNTPGGDWTTQITGLGTISGVVNPSNANASIDTHANYVFFYQVVSTSGGGTINTFNVNSYSTPYTSGGYMNKVFNDGAPVGPSGNQYIGANPGSFTPDPVTSKPTASNLSLASTPFTNPGTPAPTNPSFITSLGGAGLGGGAATFLWLTGLSGGAYSPVLILTSNTSPTYSAGSISPFAGTPSSGGIPTQAPEPATLAMWGLGAVGLAFVARRRKKTVAENC